MTGAWIENECEVRGRFIGEPPLSVFRRAPNACRGSSGSQDEVRKPHRGARTSTAIVDRGMNLGRSTLAGKGGGAAGLVLITDYA
jgi:hypothetical protein